MQAMFTQHAADGSSRWCSAGHHHRPAAARRQKQANRRQLCCCRAHMGELGACRRSALLAGLWLLAAPLARADNEGFPSLRDSNGRPAFPEPASRPDFPEPVSSPAPSPQPTSTSSFPRPEYFETSEYYFKLPGSLDYAPIDPPPAAPGRPGQTATPLRARFEDSSSQAVFTVVTQDTASLKPTIFQELHRHIEAGRKPVCPVQSQSIQDLGTPEQVARMILPRGSEVVSYSSQQYTQPDRDLIDLALTQPRQQSYRYEFKSTGEDGKGARVHALLAALVIKGRLWLAGGTVPEQQWSQAQPGLTQAVDTFRLVRPVR